jgi:hypothetical protein
MAVSTPPGSAQPAQQIDLFAREAHERRGHHARDGAASAEQRAVRARVHQTEDARRDQTRDRYERGEAASAPEWFEEGAREHQEQNRAQ